MGQRVIVKEVSSENKSSSGIVLGGDNGLSYQKGEVVASGIQNIKKGDEVLFHRDHYVSVNETGEALLVVAEEAIIAKITDDS